MGSEKKDICVTLDGNNTTYKISPDLSYDHYAGVKDGKLFTSVAVPFAELGLAPSDIKAGAELAINLLRITGTSANAYAGWLAWGDLFGNGNDLNPDSFTNNVIVLRDIHAQDGDEGDGFESLLTNIHKAANGLVSAEYIDGGHEIVTTE